jgi:uncharacterized damage-inducible protein DinB
MLFSVFRRVNSKPAVLRTIRHRIRPAGLSYNPRMTLFEFFPKQKEAVRARSKEVFALLRPEHMNWKPEKGALSVGEMLRHLWVSEEGVRRCALEGDFSYYETRMPKGLRAVTGSPRSLAEELADIDRSHRETLAAVAARSPEFFEEERAHAGLGFRRKVAVMLFGINEHEVHHRAQLMTYLRMLGSPAPEPFKLPKK